MDLEHHLRDRLSDSRAMTGALDINDNRVLLKFGDLGPLKAIVLAIKGNEISIVSPGDLANAWNAEDVDKRGGKAQAVDGATLTGDLITAHFDGERLFAGAGGPEIALPPEFFDAAREAITAEIAANGATSAENGSGADSASANENGAGGADTGNGAGDKPEWIDFEKHKLDDLKALADKEGVELTAEDSTKREIAVKINAKRGAVEPTAE